MKKVLAVLSFIFISNLCFSQVTNKNKGSLLININSGFRGSFSSHSTPQLSFNGTIAAFGVNDRIVFSPAWDLQGTIGFALSKIPLSFGVQSGVQWNENVHYVGEYPSLKKYPPIRIKFRTLNFGVWVGYDLIKRNKHTVNTSIAANALYIPSSYPDFKTGKFSTDGYIYSKDRQDSTEYTNLINSISNNVKISWQLETSIGYRYSFPKHFDLGFSIRYQLGLTNLLNTSAVFFNSTDPNYTGNSSFSVNKGDGICFNVDITYKIPFYKNL